MEIFFTDKPQEAENGIIFLVHPQGCCYICIVMGNKEILNTIKSTVHTFLPDARILLFGSRARGEFHNGSDYDLLVVTEKTFTPKAKLNWKTKIHLALVDALELPFDILLNSEKEITYKKDLPGHVVRNALKEAIEL